MRYFHKLIDGGLVKPLLHQVMRQPNLWNQDRVGTENGSEDEMFLRAPTNGSLIAYNRPEMGILSPAFVIAPDLINLSAIGGSAMGSIVLIRLAPGKKLLPHRLNGEYAEFYDRHLVVLQSLPGALMTCGDETVNLITGEVWWFSAKDEHMV